MKHNTPCTYTSWALAREPRGDYVDLLVDTGDELVSARLSRSSASLRRARVRCLPSEEVKARHPLQRRSCSPSRTRDAKYPSL
jgi:hypothetical protein